MILSTAYFPPVEYFARLAGARTVYLEACESYRKQTWRNRCRILTANGPMDLRVPVRRPGGSLPDGAGGAGRRMDVSGFGERGGDVRHAVVSGSGEGGDAELAVVSGYDERCGTGRLAEVSGSGVAQESAGGERGDRSRLISEIRIDWSTDWLRRTQYAIDTAYYSSPFFEYYRDEMFALMDRRPERLWDLNLDLIKFFCSKIGIAPEIIPTSDWQAEWEDDLRESIDPKRPSQWSGRPYWQVFRERFGFTPGLSVMDLLFNEGPESLSYLL